jgi:hypothetical protein
LDDSRQREGDVVRCAKQMYGYSARCEVCGDVKSPYDGEEDETRHGGAKSTTKRFFEVAFKGMSLIR